MKLIENCSKQWFQGLCAAVHMAAFLIMVLAAADKSIFGTTGSFKFYIQSTNTTDMMPVEIGEWSVFIPLAAFSLVTSSFHSYYFVNSNGDGDYSYDGALRYLEYAITASIMFVVIAILVGVVDLYTLLAIFGLSASTMLFGYAEEKTVSVRDYPFVLRPFFLGWVPYVIAWAILLTHFLRVGSSDIPAFVYIIFVGEIMLFSCFAAVSWFYVVKPKQVFSVKEMNGWYNLLSLTSKSLLVWLAFGGIVSMDG